MGSIWTHRNSPLYQRLSQRKNKQRINQDSLLVTGAVQEGHDLTARAGLVGAEQTAADTAGDVVLLRPGDRRRVVSVRGHRGKFFCRPLSVRYFFSISSCKSRLTWV